MPKPAGGVGHETGKFAHLTHHDFLLQVVAVYVKAARAGPLSRFKHNLFALFRTRMVSGVMMSLAKLTATRDSGTPAADSTPRLPVASASRGAAAGAASVMVASAELGAFGALEPQAAASTNAGANSPASRTEPDIA